MTNQLDYTAVGERIRQTRKERGLTQEQLAEACGLSTSFVGHIERGTRILSVDTLYQISLQLKVQYGLPALGFGRAGLPDSPEHFSHPENQKQTESRNLPQYCPDPGR